MDCLAAPKYQKRPGCKRQLHDAVTLAFQNASDDFLLIIQTPNTRHIFKEPALARLLQHERDRELRFVKMPAMLTAVNENIDRAGSKGICKTKERFLAQH